MGQHICPPWVGYLLVSPVRKLFQHPDTLLGQHVKAGMTVLDVGCAMGFFSIPAARIVGRTGRVVCIDCQPKMISRLKKRARRAKVEDRIETRVCEPTDLKAGDMAQQVDVALAVAMIHEVQDKTALLSQVAASLKPGGVLLISEPKGHVTPQDMDETLRICTRLGLQTAERVSRKRTFSYIAQKPAQ